MLELEVVGRVRVFVVDEERFTLVRERVELELVLELERVTRDRSVERVTLVRERVALELVLEFRYFERESLLVVDESDRLEAAEEDVERL